MPIHGYLAGPYLAEPYLSGVTVNASHMQVHMEITPKHHVNAQVFLKITGTPLGEHMQLKHRRGLEHRGFGVYLTHPYLSGGYLGYSMGGFAKMQVKALHANNSRMQANMVIYNTSQLRILDVFASRGVASAHGMNWTVTPPAAAGDFSINNVNTDIVEQVYRSQDGDIASIQAICDTGLTQGVFIDTFAMLGHNLTTSATVVLQGSNVSDFSTIGINIPVTTEKRNSYWIAPTLPNQSFRYWKLNIQDPSNPDNFIKIGVIVFGTSKIFTLKENFINPIQSGLKDFKDAIATEGFTNVMNERAIRKFVKLSFENLDFSKGNYSLMQGVFETARTTQKCLWVPTPQYASRHAIFAKLVQLPEIEHEALEVDQEYTKFDVELDESL